MFETRSDAWEKVGLSFEVNEKVVKKAQRQAVLFLVLVIAVVIGSHILLDHSHQEVVCKGSKGCYTATQSLVQKWGVGWLATPIQILGVIAVVAFGWGLARAIGRFVGPTFLRRMDPATAGTFGFIVRLVTMGIALILALNVAGASLASLAVGGAFTAVILGLAAQQTLGNVLAGLVLLSARPFRVGERVRLQGGPLAGTLEGTVSSLGLLYTTFATGEDSIMVPNSVVLNVAVLPLHEPEAVDLRARLRAGMTPGDLQEILERELQTPLRDAPRITLEELDGEDVVVRISATPRVAAQGRQLASELLDVVSRQTRSSEATA